MQYSQRDRVLFLFILALNVNPGNAGIVPFRDLTLLGDLSSVSKPCMGVFQQSLECDDRLLSVDSSKYYSNEYLTALCTKQCSLAVDIFARRAIGACCDSTIVTTDGKHLKPSYLAMELRSSYKSVCLTANGKFCNREIGEIQKHASTDEQLIMSDKSEENENKCSDCMLAIIRNTVEDPFTYQPELHQAYVTHVKDCGHPELEISLPKATDNLIFAGSDKPICKGDIYVVKDGDTCQSISKEQSVSTTTLLVKNGLRAGCLDFPLEIGTELCIESHCETAPIPSTAKGIWDCRSIAAKYIITYAQLVSWNPEIDAFCANIESIVGTEICISNPSGIWKNDISLHSPVGDEDKVDAIPLIPTDSWIPGTSIISGSSDDLPKPNMKTQDLQIEDFPFGKGTREDCFAYFVAKGEIPTCQIVADRYHVSMEEFLGWNYGLSRSRHCELERGVRYCAQLHDLGISVDEKTPESTNRPPPGNDNAIAPGKTHAGTSPYCVQFKEAWVDGDCKEFVDFWSVNREDFIKWNPAVGQDCQLAKGKKTRLSSSISHINNCSTDYSYCIKASGMRAAGEFSKCNKWVIAQVRENPAERALVCHSIEYENGLSHGRFVSWNPSVKNDCKFAALPTISSKEDRGN